MPYEIVLPDCDIQRFSEMFLSKSDFQKITNEMNIKERLFDRKTTNALEENFKNHIISNALVKLGGKALTTTSYLIDNDSSSATAYLSYGGKRLQLTAEGRVDDKGYFLNARQTKEGIRLRIESKRDHYKTRTRASNAFFIILGLVLGIIPGILIAIFIFFIEPRLFERQIDKLLMPAIEKTFGRIQF